MNNVLDKSKRIEEKPVNIFLPFTFREVIGILLLSTIAILCGLVFTSTLTGAESNLFVRLM